MDARKPQDANSKSPSRHRNFKTLKQVHLGLPKTNSASSSNPKKVHQNVTVCDSRKDTSSDGMGGTSIKREPIPSLELSKATENQGKRHVIPSDNNKKPSKSSSAESNLVYCYTCESVVTENYIFKHLFFGQLRCSLCSLKIPKCDKLSSMYYSKEICRNRKGPHSYTHWMKEPDIYLQYCIRRELVIKSHYEKSKPPTMTAINLAVALYIRKLQILKSHQPWQLAFDREKYFIKIEKLLSESKTQQAQSVNNRTVANNEFRERGSEETCASPVKSNTTVGNALTSKENVRVKLGENPLVRTSDPKEPSYSKKRKLGENPLARTNDPKETDISKKRMKLRQRKDCDDNESHVNEVNSTRRKSKMIQDIGQCSKSASKSLTSTKENVHTVSVDKNPLAETSNLRKSKRLGKKVKSNQCNESNFAQLAKLAGDQCLTVHQSKDECPEMCPKCQRTLCISNLTFDCSTFIMKMECPDCSFPVYIMPNRKTKSIFQKRLL